MTNTPIPTDTPPDLALALAGLTQQVNELCAALADIHSTACIALSDDMNTYQRSMWAKVRAAADEAVSQVRRQQQTHGEVK